MQQGPPGTKLRPLSYQERKERVMKLCSDRVMVLLSSLMATHD